MIVVLAEVWIGDFSNKSENVTPWASLFHLLLVLRI